MIIGLIISSRFNWWNETHSVLLKPMLNSHNYRLHTDKVFPGSFLFDIFQHISHILLQHRRRAAQYLWWLPDQFHQPLVLTYFHSINSISCDFQLQANSPTRVVMSGNPLGYGRKLEHQGKHKWSPGSVQVAQRQHSVLGLNQIAGAVKQHQNLLRLSATSDLSQRSSYVFSQFLPVDQLYVAEPWPTSKAL